MKDFLIYHKISLVMLLSCCALYLSFAYDLQRTDFVKLVTLYGALFYLSWKFFQIEKTNTKLLLGTAILFRLLFLFAVPNLSQDFYRFIWDGQLLLNGINPYLHTPDALLASETIPLAKELHAGMGNLSAGNFSNYPPLNQLLFAIAAFFSNQKIIGTVIAMRIMIIAADIGIFYFGKKLLKNLNVSENRIFLYLLNPFIIIELTGNLHFEAVMIFFIIWSLYLLQKGKWVASAVVFALSVSVKLIPLLFLPLFFQKLKSRKTFGFYAIVAAVNLLLFLPFVSSEFIQNYTATVALWFQKFEFNASVYYLIRWIGFQVEGYNIIGTAGKVLALLVFVSVLLLAFFRNNKNVTQLITSMLLAISFYYLMSTTVHPWYIAVPVALCIFTNYRFPLIWSLMVVLSYSAYANSPFEENLWLIALEYLVVIGFFIWEASAVKKEHFPIFR